MESSGHSANTRATTLATSSEVAEAGHGSYSEIREIERFTFTGMIFGSGNNADKRNSKWLQYILFGGKGFRVKIWREDIGNRNRLIQAGFHRSPWRMA